MTPRRLARAAFVAAAALAAGAASPTAAAQDESQLTFARMAGALIGGGAPALTPAERGTLDAEGNRNAQYDVGDVRLMLYRHPELVPTGTVRTSADPR
jgi:hypothetical protein